MALVSDSKHTLVWDNLLCMTDKSPFQTGIVLTV